MRNLKELKQTVEESLSYLSLLNCEIEYKERGEETRERLRRCAPSNWIRYEILKREGIKKIVCEEPVYFDHTNKTRLPPYISCPPVHVVVSYSCQLTLFRFILFFVGKFKDSLFNFCPFSSRETINYLGTIIHSTSSFDKVCI